MGNKRHLLDSLMDSSQQAVESLAGQPIIEIAGDRRVLIENHLGVKEYGYQKITILVPYGCVCIAGCDLELARMTKEQLVISGKIQCIQLHRKERK